MMVKTCNNSVFLKDCAGLVTPKKQKFHFKTIHLEKAGNIFAMIKIIQRLAMHLFDKPTLRLIFRGEVLLFTFWNKNDH